MNCFQLALFVSLAVPAAPNTATTPGGVPVALAADEQSLKAANLTVSGPGLLDFFRKRIPSAENDAAVEPLVKKLTGKDAAEYPKASGELVALGPAAVKQLRIVANNIQDTEAAARARQCLQAIEGQAGANLVGMAARILGALKPEGAAQVLITYHPFADNETVAGEIETALAQVAVREGKPNQALVQALTDENTGRRSAAAVALCQAGGISVHELVRPLLKDPKPTVRFQIAIALGSAHDAEAVPVLINLLSELPPAQRKEAEEWLSELAGDWTLKVPQGNDMTSRRLRRELWLAWWKSLEGKQLAEEFTSRTLSDEDRETVLDLIKKLDDNAADVREKASQDLVGWGPKAVPLLRQASQNSSPRLSTMSVKCVELIEKESPNPLPYPAARLLALRRPEGTLEIFLAYLPFAENEAVASEVRDLIAAIGIREGKADPLLVKALKDKAPARRAVAAFALCKVESAEHLPAVRKLLEDPDNEVRLRAAQALASIRQREAVPVLIALLAELPLQQGWEIEDYLSKLAAEKGPAVPLTTDPATRAKARDAWAEWWKDQGHTVDLAKVGAAERYLGLSLVVETYDPATRMGRVVELDPGGKVRWKIEGINYPMDAQVLPGQRVLIAEQNGGRVTERDFTGKVLWEKTGLAAPFVAQRQRNGNTFIALRNVLLEVDREGKQVLMLQRPNDYFMAATKFRDGQMAVVTNQGDYIRLDATGKEVKRYRIPFNPNWGFNTAEILPNDNVILSVQGLNTITEFSPDGKTVWEAKVQHAGTPTRLPNGNTIAPNTNNLRLAELDRNGKIVSEMKDLSVRPWRVTRR